MAEAAKKTVNANPKVFRVPADLRPLENHATIIINQMRAAHRWRMTDGVKQIRKGAAKP
jgi:hypothetical protein